MDTVLYAQNVSPRSSYNYQSKCMHNQYTIMVMQNNCYTIKPCMHAHATIYVNENIKDEVRSRDGHCCVTMNNTSGKCIKIGQFSFGWFIFRYF